MLLDVFLLASLYTLRIIGGGAATQIHISNWLLVFSLFFFLSLAFLKRYSELQGLPRHGQDVKRFRGYLPEDVELLRRPSLPSLAAVPGTISLRKKKTATGKRG